MTEDKIVKAYNFTSKNEEFLVSHCDFPGSSGEINLATLLRVGNHVIGENCLTFEQIDKKPKEGKTPKLHPKKQEWVAPNNFN